MSNAATMEKLIGAHERAVVDLRARGVMYAVDELVGRIPVDTGRHRTGIRVAAGSPSQYRGAPGKKKYPRPPRPVMERAAKNAKLADDIYVSIRGPVPQLLEDGRSKQAPRGFVTQSIAAGAAKLKKERVS